MSSVQDTVDSNVSVLTADDISRSSTALNTISKTAYESLKAEVEQPCNFHCNHTVMSYV